MAFEQASRVLLIFKADTKQAQREIRNLSKEQKKAAQTTIDAQDKANEGLEKQIKTLAKVGIAVGAAVLAFKGLINAAKEYARVQKLELASAGVNIDKLQEATGGLVTKTQAMSVAARSLSSDFQLTQKEMENTAKFATILHRRTLIPLEEVMRDLAQATGEANPEALKKYGVIIKTETNTHKGHADLMARIKRETDAAGEVQLSAGEKVDAAQVAWVDAIEALNVAFGQLGVALTPVIEGLSKFIKLTADILSDPTGSLALLKSKGEAAKLENARRELVLSTEFSIAAADAVLAGNIKLGRELQAKAAGALQRSKDITTPTPTTVGPRDKDVAPKRKDIAFEFEGTVLQEAGEGQSRTKQIARALKSIFAFEEAAINARSTEDVIQGLRDRPVSRKRFERDFGVFANRQRDEARARERAEKERTRIAQEQSAAERQRRITKFGAGTVGRVEGGFDIFSGTDLGVQGFETMQDVGVSAFSALTDSSVSFGQAMRRAGCQAAQGHAINLFGMGVANLIAGNRAKGGAAIAASVALLLATRKLCPGSAKINLPASAALGAAAGGLQGRDTARIFVVNAFGDSPRETRRNIGDALDRTAREQGVVNEAVEFN